VSPAYNCARRFSRRLIVGLLMAAWSGSQAQAGTSVEIGSQMRLSQWLNARPDILPPHASLPNAETPYLPGLTWMVPEEAEAQRRDKQRLLDRIRSPETTPGVARADAEGLAGFVAALPVTGRVVVERTDPRWLEVNAQYDPPMKPGQRLVVPSRPTTVTLVRGDGQTCQVRHEATRHARDYVRRCDGSGDPQWAWIVQPDGLVQRAGVAEWNESEQDPPAPGAWIVVADTRIPWPETVPEQLARFLATQGEAADMPAERVVRIEQEDDGIATWLNHTPRDNALTLNDWGTVGLIQTPTARMASAGNAALTLSRAYPYTRMTGTMQIMDWFELAVRWSSVSNRYYGPANFSGGQAYKDKSVDFKVRLLEESAMIPQLAVGLRDLGGTGLFSGEYVVASKRAGNLDWSLGLGWGYLGARGNLGNPLSVLSPKFNTRVGNQVATGGTVNSGSMFRGHTSLFGGVQYQTPWQDVLLKLEYDGNDYQHEPQANNQKQTTPFNFGAVYRINSGADLAVNWERGTTLAMGLSLHGDLSKLSMPKLSDPVIDPVSELYPEQEPDWERVAALLEEKTSWKVVQIRRAGSELVVRFRQADIGYWNDAVDRIASVLHANVPGKDILIFRIQSEDYGLDLHEFQIDRRAWVEAKTGYVPLHRRGPTVHEQHAYDQPGHFSEQMLFGKAPDMFSGNTGMALDHSFGGPEGLLYKIGWGGRGNLQLGEHSWWTGSLQVGLIDNYDKFVYPASNSTLPRVRTYVQEYAATSRITMPVFQFTHADRVGGDHFYSVYGGMLESMYGGVGGEWLYRPWQSPLAFGVDVNAVRQRGFGQDFTLRPYKTLTGHASLYWDTGFQGVNATVRAGRYLAGDWGATLDLSRVFDNGVKMGAFATKTDVSAAQFGEGSFDKGVYLTMPFDAMMTRSSSDTAAINWHPLLRDGGAMLARQFPLFDLTGKQRGNLLRWGPWSKERRTEFGEVADAYPEGGPGRSVFARAKGDLGAVGGSLATSEFWRSLFWMGGVTLATSVLDKPADRVAVKYGARKPAKAFENGGNLLPFAALGASGLVYMIGEPDGKLTTTAYSSLAAGGIGLAGSVALKYAIGRDRPSAGNGPASFSAGARSNSSMPSGHATIMWAAVTPYAKAYDAPWLYGMAAVTNLARVGGRNHWLSDTVAGSLLGYAIGDFMYRSHRGDVKGGANWSLSPDGVTAYWKLD
jgi:membrane-associated phospholipid phosphatase